MIQRDRSSGRVFFYPRVAEPRSGSADLEWIEPSGRGTVYSTTVARVRPPERPYNIALIDLEEGPRVLSRVDGVEPDRVTIGMRVKASIDRSDGQALLVFLPLEDAVEKAAQP